MKDFFWQIFEKSGDINAFLAYKEYNDFEQAVNMPEKKD